MGNLRFLVALTVLCAVFGNIWAQNRGSSRYAPPAEEYDGESTRAPRVASARGVSVRRQRPTPVPEPSEVEDAPGTYQSRQTPSRESTTGRRVASRVSPQQYSPPPPSEPHLPEEPVLLLPVEDLPPAPPTSPEGRPLNKRRRTKKRKRPQGSIPKPVEESEKLNIETPDKNKAPIPEYVDAVPKAPQVFEGTHENVNAPPPNFVSPTDFQDNPYMRYADNIDDSHQRESGPPKYYPPQTGTNRLPVENSEEIQSSRRYPAPAVENQEVPNRRYVPPSPAAEAPSRASYVPVLSPVRVPSEPRSRLPSEDFSKERTSDTVRDRHAGPTDHRSSQRTSSNRTPSQSLPDPSEIIRNSGARTPKNNIFRNDQQDVPKRDNSEVRLPQPEDLPIPGDKSYRNEPSYDSGEEELNRYEEEARPIEDNIGRETPIPTNRLLNPTESQYDSVYPTYLDDGVDREPSRNSIPRQNQEAAPLPSRNTVPNRGSVRQDAVSPPKENSESDSGRRQISRYQPPLQRTSSRYNPEESDTPSRSRAPQPSPEVPSRTRGSSRTRQEPTPEANVRTRGSSRYQSESSIDTPTRTRGIQSPDSNPQVTRSHNTQRYQPEPIESDSRLTTSRRQPANPQHRQPAPVLPYIEESASPQDSLRSPSESEEDYDPNPVRHTMRARPQFEIREAPQPYEEALYEEPVDEQRPPSAYVPEYQSPRQQDRHEPPIQRSPPPREQAPRQQHNRRDNVDHRTVAREPQPHSRAPQHNTRSQPQYEAPRREPSPPRQATPRQQSRARQPEPPSAPQKARSSSKFSCPEPYGFFGDPVQCDRYYECRNGTAYDNLCEDGLAFNEINAPKYLRCDSLRDVDCAKRPELQEAQPTKNCPRRFGLYPHETDCTKFWNCVDGTSTEVQCPPGLTFNNDKATCDWADLVQTSCKTEDLLGFNCPEANSFDLQDGVYTSYPHPENCQLHFVCIKGTDGERRPRLLSCNEGLVYSTESSSCTRPDNVPGCEDFYGKISPAPKRKPSREPEELEEEPKPRRTQNRRTRN